MGFLRPLFPAIDALLISLACPALIDEKRYDKIREKHGKLQEKKAVVSA